MSTAARRRLMRDFKRLQEDPPAGVSGAPGENNIMLWNAVIFGPHDTPFEDGTFKLTMEFTEEYPNKPPVVKFLSKMFHPNIYADGGICLDILQNRCVRAINERSIAMQTSFLAHISCHALSQLIPRAMTHARGSDVDANFLLATFSFFVLRLRGSKFRTAETRISLNRNCWSMSMCHAGFISCTYLPPR